MGGPGLDIGLTFQLCLTEAGFDQGFGRGGACYLTGMELTGGVAGNFDQRLLSYIRGWLGVSSGLIGGRWVE